MPGCHTCLSATTTWAPPLPESPPLAPHIWSATTWVSCLGLHATLGVSCLHFPLPGLYLGLTWCHHLVPPPRHCTGPALVPPPGCHAWVPHTGPPPHLVSPPGPPPASTTWVSPPGHHTATLSPPAWVPPTAWVSTTWVSPPGCSCHLVSTLGLTAAWVYHAWSHCYGPCAWVPHLGPLHWVHLRATPGSHLPGSRAPGATHWSTTTWSHLPEPHHLSLPPPLGRSPPAWVPHAWVSAHLGVAGTARTPPHWAPRTECHAWCRTLECPPVSTRLGLLPGSLLDSLTWILLPVGLTAGLSPLGLTCTTGSHHTWVPHT
ncbi:hypothetical protein GPJ56_007225 [Histomonas meleagridis]|nr:hypothetical protein GPJ56_007225 [Histomonas meleagridis]